MIEDKLRAFIAQAIRKEGVLNPDIKLEYPSNLSHGDFSTNVAMVEAKIIGLNPIEFAKQIAEHLNKNKIPEVNHVEVAGPGFINFYLSKEFFVDTITEAFSNESWGKNELFTGKKILVEHSSPNIFKPFHIGHVMNNAIGESITRLARYSGAQVTAISYPSDVSLGIGKAVYVLMNDGGIQMLQKMTTSQEQLAYLGECYVRGTKEFEENPDIQPKVKDITKILYDNIPSEELDAYTFAKNINLEYFKTIVERLGSAFDEYIYESEAGKEGEKIVRAHIPALFKVSEGAVIYEGESEGLHTRVFINREGYPTYEAKDIGFLSLKFSRFDPDLSIFVTDNEQADYFSVVIAAAGKINKEWQDKTIHRTHGRMSFKGQKMSSRLGGVPLAETLIDTVTDEVKERSANLTSLSLDVISIGAMKFVILRAMAGKNINFDPDTSLSFEGDSGPYLQYTAVRAASLLVKARDAGLTPSPETSGASIVDLERMLARFPSIVRYATESWAPHHIVGYLLELGQTFNAWYATTKIIDENNLNASYHLALVSVLENTMKKGLWLLGITVPTKM